jgi:peptidoglycan/LPS O-acetylase OafA/YrhL
VDTGETSLVQKTPDANLGQQKSQRFYRPELDTLRFFAFFGVFVFHIILNEAFFYQSHHFLFPAIVPTVCAVAGAGAYGVDLFFALSAFLITTLLIREEEVRGTIDTSAFYVRRILRICPLYFFFIAVAAMVPLWDRSQHLWPFIAISCSQEIDLTFSACHSMLDHCGVSPLERFTWSGRLPSAGCRATI